MEKIGNLLKQGEVCKSIELKAISQPSPQLSDLPRWITIALQMAQDKRHDLSPDVLRYWREKLKSFRDEDICDALMYDSWEWFPSVDEVIRSIEGSRATIAGREYINRDWERYETLQRRAETEGLLATEDDYEKARQAIREILARPSLRAK